MWRGEEEEEEEEEEVVGIEVSLGLGWYLFLHVAQLVAQVAVDLHQLLDLGLGGGQRALHILELLYGHRAVRQVRVQTLWRGMASRRWGEW